MANELLRVVATVRVKSLGDGFDADQLAEDVSEYYHSTALKNAGLNPVNNDHVAQVHVHISTDTNNCESCMRHAMDEMQ